MKRPVIGKLAGLAIAGLAAAMGLPAVVATPADAANLLTKGTNLPTLTLSAGKAFPKEAMQLEAGKYYRWKIESDGTSEMAIQAPEFFRFIWINEVVINDIEVRPLGLHSLEFDSKGAATISFVPIRPGEYEYFMPNSKSDAFRGKIIVK
jgi:hypothetical protein